MSVDRESEKIPLLNKMFFGSGDIFGGGAFNIINFFYAIFLTDVVGLDMVFVAPVFLIGKIWDAITDPFMGSITDRTRSRFGRRRPYFLAGIVLVFISFMILWYPVDFDTQAARFLYILFAYLFFNTVVTMIMIPYQAMAAEISLDYNERTSVNSIRLLFSLASSLICALIPMMIVNSFEDMRAGYIAMSVVFGLIFSLPWIGVFAFTKERQDFSSVEANLNLKSMFVEPLKIRSFRYLLAMFLTAYLGMDIVSMIFAYYMKYYIEKPNALPLVLGVLLIVEILFIPFYAFLAKKKDKTFSFILGSLVWIIGSGAIFFIPRNASLPVVFFLAGFVGAGVSAAAVIPHTIFGDVTDVGELAYGQRREGNFSGLITFTRKFASGVAVALATLILGVAGYANPERVVENGVTTMIEKPQGAAVLLTIRLIISLAPVVLMALGIIAAKKYPLDSESHRRLIDYLNKKRHNEKTTLSDEEFDELKRRLI